MMSTLSRAVPTYPPGLGDKLASPKGVEAFRALQRSGREIRVLMNEKMKALNELLDIDEPSPTRFG
jgi:hypothetical protein